MQTFANYPDAKAAAERIVRDAANGSQVATPSPDEYWHMGETPMRLRNVTDLIVSGENKWCEFPLSLFIGSDFITVLTENKKYPAWVRISGGIRRHTAISGSFRRIEKQIN